MGWDYTHATHYTRTGAIDKKAEIDELTPGRTTRKNMRLSALAWSGLHIMPQ